MKRYGILLLLLALALTAWAQSADELLIKIDGNRAYTSIQYSARMEIRTGSTVRAKTMKAWSIGADKALIEFTNPEDRGIRMLKLGKDLWMYFPKEQDTVRISGHLLKEGMMGSDISYEDALETDKIAEMYSASITGNESVEGRQIVVLELKAKDPRAKYDRRVLRVDTLHFIVISEDMYARSGKLIKTTRVLETRNIGNRWFPVRVEMSDKLRKDSTTLFILEAVELDKTIDPALFTRAALEK